MIQRSDILSIPYLKKAVFTGSCQGMRYRLEKVAAEDADALLATIWEGPYCYDMTTEEQRETCQFPFTEEGICQAADWLNEKWVSQEERWRKAMSRW